MAKEQALAKQKEALKSKVSGSSSTSSSGKGTPKQNNTGTKSSAPAPKKQLTLETGNMLDNPADKEPIPAKKEDDDEEEDDDFARSETPPMTKEQLEEGSSNSVQSLQRPNGPDETKPDMQQTLSSSQLMGLILSNPEGDTIDEEQKQAI